MKEVASSQTCRTNACARFASHSVWLVAGEDEDQPFPQFVIVLGAKNQLNFRTVGKETSSRKHSRRRMIAVVNVEHFSTEVRLCVAQLRRQQLTRSRKRSSAGLCHVDVQFASVCERSLHGLANDSRALHDSLY